MLRRARLGPEERRAGWKSLAEADIDVLMVVVLVIPLSVRLGDQQAALVGHVCPDPGEANNTYGNGSFLLFNRHRVGPLQERVAEHRVPIVRRSAVCLRPRRLDRGYRVRGAVPARPARADLGCLAERDAAREVEDNGGVCFVPALSRRTLDWVDVE